MKQCVVTVEVATADQDLVRVFETSIDHVLAKERIESAACDPRALPDVVDTCEGDISVTVWNNVDDEDEYLVVHFPGDIACKAIARYFRFDARILREAAALDRVEALQSDQRRYHAKALHALGLADFPTEYI